MKISAGTTITFTDGESLMTIQMTTDPWTATGNMGWECTERSMGGRWAKAPHSAGSVGPVQSGYWHTTYLFGLGYMLHLVDLRGKPVLILNLDGNREKQGRGIYYSGGKPGHGTKIRGFTDIPEYSWKGLWFGMGVKFGGQLAVIGVETMVACLVNVAQRKICSAVLQGIRPGVGLGGSTGLTGVLAFNFTTPESMLGYQTDGLDFTVSLGENWATILKGLEKYPKGIEMMRGLPKLIHSLQEAKEIAGRLESVENLTNWAKMLASFSGADPSQQGFTSFDIPSGGTGLELSLVYTHSTVIQVNGMDAPEAHQAPPKHGVQNAQAGGLRPRGRDR